MTKEEETRHCEYCGEPFKVVPPGYRAELCPPCRKERYRSPTQLAKRLAKKLALEAAGKPAPCLR